MKVSKTGITMYEDSDPAPKASNATNQCMIMIGLLRKEINKIALVLDRLQEEIDSTKETAQK